MLKTLFAHIPKTGGTSIKGLFVEHYGADAIAELNGQTWAGYKHDSSSAIKHISGHFDFFKMLRDEAVSEDFAAHGQFILTVVRDPIERWISDYRYICATPNHPRKDDVESSMEEYLVGRRPNAQCVWLGIECIGLDSSIQFSFESPMLEKLVILNMDQLDEELPILWEALFGKKISVPRKLVGARADFPELKPELKERLYDIHRKDFALVVQAKTSGLQLALEKLGITS